MMESIRTGVQKPWVKFLLAITVLSFVFAGYFTSSSFSGSADAIAEINGEEIRLNELNKEVRIAASRYGDQFNTFFSTDEAKAKFRLEVLDNLINKKILEQEAEALGFRASDQQIVEQLHQIPAFQLDGKFSTALMDQYLASEGESRSSFRARFANSIALAQFFQLLSTTEMTFPYEVDQRLALEYQTRNVQGLVVPNKLFADKVEISDAEIDSYYQSNIRDYEVQEKVSVEYIELKAETMLDAITVSDQEVEEFYKGNQDLYQSEEERRVAHILIKSEDRSDEEAQEKIKAIVEEIAAGGDFAEIAKLKSEDFSATDGGDLGFAGRGVMDAEFEKAMFDLAKVGDVSGVVKTEFGYHVLQLLEIKSGDVRALEEVKEQIAGQIKADKAEKEFYLKKNKLAELAFSNYSTLSVAAAEGELTVMTSEPFNRQGGFGIFANQELVAEAFSTEVLQDGRNSGAVDLSDTHMVILRAKEYTPARTKSLDEVKAEVTAMVRNRKAREAAESFGQELLAKLEQGSFVDSEIAELGIEWKKAENVTRNSSELGFELTRIAFKAPKPSAENRSFVGQSMLNGDYAIVHVESVNMPSQELSEAQKQQAEARISRAMSDSATTALLAALREKYSIKVYQDRIQ